MQRILLIQNFALLSNRHKLKILSRPRRDELLSTFTTIAVLCCFDDDIKQRSASCNINYGGRIWKHRLCSYSTSVV